MTEQQLALLNYAYILAAIVLVGVVSLALAYRYERAERGEKR